MAPKNKKFWREGKKDEKYFLSRTASELPERENLTGKNKFSLESKTKSVYKPSPWRP